MMKRYTNVKQFVYSTSFLIILLLSSCDRKEFRTYKGQYECQLAARKWVEGGLNEYTISPGYLIEVFKDKKDVYLLGHLIHIDSIEPNTPYEWQAGEKYYTLRFFNDSIRYSETVYGDTSVSRIYVGGKTK